MNGNLLKARLQTIEPNLAEAARKLNMSKQSFYQALEAADIKSGLIERIATLYNRPVGFFFDDCFGNDSQIQNRGSHNQMAGRDVNTVFNLAEHDELIKLREEVKYIRRLLCDKDDRIAELKERIEELKSNKNE